jgi:hypothetical protein
MGTDTSVFVLVSPLWGRDELSSLAELARIARNRVASAPTRKELGGTAEAPSEETLGTAEKLADGSYSLF